VIDTRGFRVRGARVSLRSVPAHAFAVTRAKLSAADGRASFLLRASASTRRRTAVALIVRAIDPAAPALANASSRLHLTITRGS
jgi:hypothetical protein